jgi:hypothetical protein
MKKLSVNRRVLQVKPLGVARYKIQDVLGWKCPNSGVTLREWLVDHTVSSGLVKIPKQYADTWTAEVKVKGKDFVVTVHP